MVEGEAQVEGVEFGKPLALSVKLPEKRHVYNPRTNEYLGKTDLAAVELDPFSAVWLSLLPYKVEKIKVELEKAEKDADPRLVKWNAEVKTSGGKPGLHVLHLEVRDPDGNFCDWHKANVVAEAGTVHSLTLEQIRDAISELGYVPRQRNVFYELADKQREQYAIEANRDFGKTALPVLA